jgi:hypothetical protein
MKSPCILEIEDAMHEAYVALEDGLEEHRKDELFSDYDMSDDDSRINQLKSQTRERKNLKVLHRKVRDMKTQMSSFVINEFGLYANEDFKKLLKVDMDGGQESVIIAIGYYVEGLGVRIAESIIQNDVGSYAEVFYDWLMSPISKVEDSGYIDMQMNHGRLFGIADLLPRLKAMAEVHKLKKVHYQSVSHDKDLIKVKAL